MRHGQLYPVCSWQDILLIFAEMQLDSRTMFTPKTNAMFIRSIGEPVLAHIVGYSEHGDAYCRISSEHEGNTIRDGHASVCCLSLHVHSPPRSAQSEDLSSTQACVHRHPKWSL